MSDQCIVCLEDADFVVPLATSYGADPADKKTFAEILSFLMRPESVSIEDGCLCLNCFNSTKDAYKISILAIKSHKKNEVAESIKVAESINVLESIKSVENIEVVQSELKPITDCQNKIKVEANKTIEYISSDEEELTKYNEVAVIDPVTLYEIIDDDLEISIENNNLDQHVIEDDADEHVIENASIEEVLEDDAVEQDMDNENEQNEDGEIYEYYVMDVVDTPEVETNSEPEISMSASMQGKIKQIAKFDCRTCDKTFTYRDNLRRHMKLHLTKLIFDCSMCPSKSFSTKLLLYNHLYKEHQLPAPHKCTKCNAGFTYLSQLKVHKISKSCSNAENEGKFVCEFCSRSFIIASNLKRHLMIHKNEKPFQCSHCSKTFNQKQALVIHERIHSKETPIQCLVCPRRFSDPSSFSKHQKSHRIQEA